MTYSYLLTVPLMGAFAIGFASIKYSEGFVSLPSGRIIPKPIELWSPLAQRSNLPLTLCLSIAWGLEMVSHLEELCFWQFLISASTTAQQDWFHSLHFKLWVVGSIIAVTYMPIITIITHSDPLKSEAYTFLAGGLGSISLTFCFIPVLFSFPTFVENLTYQKSEGVDMNTVVRLVKVSELNTIRVFFRLLFTIPLLILSIDGIRSHHRINENMFWADFLPIISALGCVLSSTITLFIFFPRAIEGEIKVRDERRRRKHGRASVSMPQNEFTCKEVTQHPMQAFRYGTQTPGSNSCLLTTPPRQDVMGRGENSNPSPIIRALESAEKYWVHEEQNSVPILPPLRPNRRMGDNIELGTPKINYLAHNFKSPIGMLCPHLSVT
ncbi:hypothetical protein C0993_002391 [Termitomyces sp. T159_Od127]|nr:hypothetical protein C0993_002391 [Termitomyces sp. T159_Od127]